MVKGQTTESAMSAAELLEAVKTGRIDEVRALLDREPAVARSRPAGQPSALLMAAYTGNDELVRLLAPHAEPDLAEAAATGDDARVTALLAGDRALVQERSGDGWTPLHLAGFFGRRGVAERLLDAGADLHAISSNATANTPLHAAIAGRNDLATVELLVRRGADVNRASEGGYTPLHIAASRGAMPVIELLLGAGAAVGTLTGDGKTAAAIAAERGHPAAAERQSL